MTATTGTLNNVNTGAAGLLVEAIEAEPAEADTTWKTTVGWDGGFRTTTTIRDFPPFATDEHPLRSSSVMHNQAIPIAFRIRLVLFCSGFEWNADPQQRRVVW